MRRVGLRRLELACWGDHFEVDEALADDGYCARKRELLERNGLECWAIGTHLVGQAVCDPIDSRHQGVLPEDVWGDGDPEGVRQRAAEKMKDTARAAARLGVQVVTGFTGSPIWHMLYSFPPNDWDEVERGYEEFAERWNPIIDVFDEEGVRFALEVHPTEIAYDFPTTEQDARRDRPARGLRDQLRPLALRPPVPRLRRRSSPSSPTASTTCTSRTRSSASTGAARSSARTSTSASPSAAGRSCRPATATWTSRTCSAQLNRIGYDGPAVDRVGGLGHGPRLGRAGRARVRAAHRLRAVVGGLRRRLREGGD